MSICSRSRLQFQRIYQCSTKIVCLLAVSFCISLDSNIRTVHKKKNVFTKHREARQILCTSVSSSEWYLFFCHFCNANSWYFRMVSTLPIHTTSLPVEICKNNWVSVWADSFCYVWQVMISIGTFAHNICSENLGRVLLFCVVASIGVMYKQSCIGNKNIWCQNEFLCVHSKLCLL